MKTEEPQDSHLHQKTKHAKSQQIYPQTYSPPYFGETTPKSHRSGPLPRHLAHLLVARKKFAQHAEESDKGRGKVLQWVTDTYLSWI